MGQGYPGGLQRGRHPAGVRAPTTSRTRGGERTLGGHQSASPNRLRAADSGELSGEVAQTLTQGQDSSRDRSEVSLTAPKATEVDEVMGEGDDEGVGSCSERHRVADTELLSSGAE